MAQDLTETDTKQDATLDDCNLHEHLDSILQSTQFSRSETLRKLLLYLWEHRDQEISEYAVATEALGRRADFDPKLDASVRVQISRLRKKLKEYYETAPQSNGIAIDLPLGGHTIVVLESQTELNTSDAIPDAEISTESAATPLPAGDLPWLPIVSALCVLLSLTTAWLGWDLHVRQETLISRNRMPTAFWNRFLGSNETVKILLPEPTFFTFPRAEQLHIRDTAVNDYSNWKKSAVISNLEETSGTPILDHAYTVTSDTLAAVQLSRYLDQTGYADRLSFEVSDDSTMGLLEHSNVVALGARSTLEPFHDYLASMNFRMAPYEAWVDNQHPLSGEQGKYSEVIEGPGRSIEPAILAVLPGKAPHVRLLLLQSRYTSALVEMLTTRTGCDLLDTLYRKRGAPDFFEAVIEIEVFSHHAIRTWPVALHPYLESQLANSGAMKAAGSK